MRPWIHSSRQTRTSSRTCLLSRELSKNCVGLDRANPAQRSNPIRTDRHGRTERRGAGESGQHGLRRGRQLAVAGARNRGHQPGGACETTAEADRRGQQQRRGNPLQEIIDLADQRPEALIPHGVSAEMLNDLREKLKVYAALRVSPRQARAVSAAATQALERLF